MCSSWRRRSPSMAACSSGSKPAISRLAANMKSGIVPEARDEPRIVARLARRPLRPAAPPPRRSRPGPGCRGRIRRRPAPARARARAVGQLAQVRRAARAWAAGVKPQVGQRVPADAVGSALQDQELRLRSARRARASAARRCRNSRIAGAGRQRHVELGARGRPAPALARPRRCRDTATRRSRAGRR